MTNLVHIVRALEVDEEERGRGQRGPKRKAEGEPACRFCDENGLEGESERKEVEERKGRGGMILVWSQQDGAPLLF